MLALGTLVAPTVVTFAVMEASPRQATLRKALVGLRVQSVDGERLTPAHALARNLVKLAPWQLAHTAVFRMAAGSQQKRWPVGGVTGVFSPSEDVPRRPSLGMGGCRSVGATGRRPRGDGRP